jgi:murein DD-endopeptidase MepM/ murein hydrolase activator NlpD
MTLSRLGFNVRRIYRLKKPSVIHIARQKLSFIIASLSLFAFIIGNMVGQHGWYAFWKSVLGKETDVTIAFVGTVPPVDKVPDYTKWAQYGGDPQVHTYRMVPQDVLVSLPTYDATKLKNRTGENFLAAIYTVGNLGSYATGADHGGSHVGVDIRVPVGTPVVSIANGVVETVSMIEVGYGHNVVIRHPNVPDPSHPGQTTTIYSIYAHLDSVLVVEGQVVHKGEQVATSGKTGDVTGPHLHFQIDRDDAPFHPYWPFTTSEAAQAHLSSMQAINNGFHQERGELYTVSPLLFVQNYETYTPSSVVASNVHSSSSSSSSSVSSVSAARRVQLVAAERLRQRLEKAGVKRPVTVIATTASVSSSAASVVSSSVASSAAVTTPSTVLEVTTVATESILPVEIVQGSNTDVDHLRIEHSGKLSRGWQRVKIVSVDKYGETVLSPSFSGRLYVVPEFGDATIRPSELSPLDFVNGVATINVLSRSNKTLFIATRGAFTSRSAPLIYER